MQFSFLSFLHEMILIFIYVDISGGFFKKAIVKDSVKSLHVHMYVCM